MDMSFDEVARSPLFAKNLMNMTQNLPTYQAVGTAEGHFVNRDDVVQMIAEWALTYREPVHYWKKIKAGQFPAWQCTGCRIVNYIEPPRGAYFCPGCGVMMKPEIET